MSIHALTLFKAESSRSTDNDFYNKVDETNEKKTLNKINPCNLNNNEPFALILKRDYKTYTKQEALLIKNNIKIVDIKLSNCYCVILDELGQVFVTSCHSEYGINNNFFYRDNNNENYNDEEDYNSDNKKENEFKLLNFTKQDPIKKIFGKFSPTFVLLSRKGNVYLFGNHRYKNYLNENNKIKEELLNGEKIVKVTCGDTHILLLTESGKIFGLGDNYYGQLGLNEYSNYGDIKFKTSQTNHISSKIVKVYATYNTSLALTENGELYGCGSTDYAASGLLKVNNVVKHMFKKIPIQEKIVKVYNGYFFVAAKTIDSKFYVFGYNNFCQFGQSKNYTNAQIYGPHLLDTFDNNEIEEMECGGYGTIIVTKNRKIFTSGDFGQVFMERKNDFGEIDLKTHLGNHQVFLNQNFKLKVRAACNFVVFFTNSSKTVSEIFNFKNIWKIYDLDFMFL
ncbi:hypothetical protein ABK040_014752 [Willaertia magna]